MDPKPMASAVVAMQWENYSGPGSAPAMFGQNPLTFNSRQERLHELGPGDSLWLVARCPDERQYYLVAVLCVTGIRYNDEEGDLGRRFGKYSVVADPTQSRDLGKRFPADGILRAFTFDKDKPIKFGASIGQSLQAIRFLSRLDEELLASALRRIDANSEPFDPRPSGLWTKCDRVFADYFVLNWRTRQEPVAFLLYDPAPDLPCGAPVFIHSNKNLRLVARYRRGLHIAGHKKTAEADERLEERDWVWERFRRDTLDPPSKSDFDDFWDGQNGVRGLFFMDELLVVNDPPQFRDYGRALEWGYPAGVGYRYLASMQCLLLARQIGLDENQVRFYLSGCGLAIT